MPNPIDIPVVARTGREKSEALRAAAAGSMQRARSIRGNAMRLTRVPAVVADNLHVWVGVKRAGEELVDDPHFVFVNPPTRVPDGTYTDIVDPESGETISFPNFVDDPGAAFEVILERAVEAHLKKAGKL